MIHISIFMRIKFLGYLFQCVNSLLLIGYINHELRKRSNIFHQNPLK